MAISRSTAVSNVHCAHFLGTWLPLEGEIRHVEDASQSSVQGGILQKQRPCSNSSMLSNLQGKDGKDVGVIVS